MSVEQVRIERERRESVAADRASQIEAGDYYASGNCVMARPHTVVLECESHWDAVLVLLARGKEKG